MMMKIKCSINLFFGTFKYLNVDVASVIYSCEQWAEWSHLPSISDLNEVWFWLLKVFESWSVLRLERVQPGLIYLVLGARNIILLMPSLRQFASFLHTYIHFSHKHYRWRWRIQASAINSAWSHQYSNFIFCFQRMSHASCSHLIIFAVLTFSFVLTSW